MNHRTASPGACHPTAGEPRTQRRPARSVALGLTTAVAIALAGCQTTDPYTGEQKVSKTTIGVGVGAAGGAIIGAIAGNRKGALIGAGIGALAGGAVGYYMDQQEAKLRAKLQGTGVSVTRSGDNIILNMPGNVTFATNSSDISSSFYPVLESVALVINEFEKTYVDVVGHTDSTGAADYNQRLSERRARSVSGYLQSQGVLQARLLTRGVGPSSPVASNDTPQGRQQNRRVELILMPVT